ncbi:MAG: oligosaccharide flippase family protein [Geobacteraceae bacterium]|nr:oligosaccharide flippase family protein [Geobacteraceae bacterium]
MYLQITYRTGGDFSRLAIVNVVQNALALMLVWLVYLFSFYGLCLRSIIVAVINLTMLWIWRPLKIKPQWNRHNFNQLLKIGAPIFFTGQIYGWWMVTDSLLVLKFAGVKGLGLYQLANMAGSAVEVLPSALAQICYPRIAEEYGRSNSISGILKIIRRPIFMLSAGIVPFILLVWLALPSIVNILLPKYVEAVPAAQWMLCSAAVLSLAPVCDIFSVTKRLDLYLAAVVVGIIMYSVSLYTLTLGGVTLKAFPQAMLCGRICYIIFSYVMVFVLVKQKHSEIGT